jgi:hypothetical protein
MKKLLSLATVALVALAVGVSADAAPQTQAALERRVAWDTQHIRQLNHRRDVLHRYIRHMRAELHAPTAATSTASSTSSTSTSSGSLTVTSSGWADELRAVGFPESAIPQMLYYINRESGGDPSALNPVSNACGLTQIYPYVPGCLDPMTNLRLAFQKYRASGFAPWGGG